MIKVSVIMNSYRNYPAHLQKAIDSYLEQQEKEIEVELILSTVKGDSAINTGRKNNCIIVISETPGIYPQINKAAKKITGDFICYASGNDVSCPNKLKLETDLLIKNNKDVCYSAFYATDVNLNLKKMRKFFPYDYKKHLTGNFVSDCSMMTKRVFDEYFPLKVEHKNHAYYDLWLRIAEGEGNVFIYNPNPTWLYRIDSNSSHILRKKNPEKIAENESNRKLMLNNHE